MSSAPISILSGEAQRAPMHADATASPNRRITIIEPRSGWRLVSPHEIWEYRELLYFLTWRDIKVQYKQTVLGPLWAVLRPVVQLVIFSVIFGKLAGIRSDHGPYPVFAFAGILPWAFFSNAVVASTGSLLSHSYLLSKIYFPRILLPTSSIGSGLVTLGINFVIYFAVALCYGHRPGPAVMFLPLLVLLTAMIALGMGYLLAGLTVIYRDIRFVVGSAIGAWMYLSPVIYPVTLVPERYQWLLILNPMTGVIGAYRTVLLNQPADWRSLSFSIGFAIVVFVTGVFVFHRTERRVADVA